VERAKKEEIVRRLAGTFREATVVVVTHQRGLTVAESTRLRRQMREVGAAYRVTKNRLAKIALAGTPYESLQDLFIGPTAIAWSHDPVAPAKVAARFAKDSGKLTIIGGALGARTLSTAEIEELARLPSLDELRARLVGLIATPGTRIAQVLNAPAGQVARVFSAYAEKG